MINTEYNVKKQETIKANHNSESKETSGSADISFFIEISERDSRRLPRSVVYVETICASDLLSKQDEEIIERIRENIGDDATDELISMSSDELENEIKEVVEEEIAEKGKLIGVLCRCYIDGCDCHEITPLGKIKEHFHLNQELPDRFSKCREYLMSNDNCAFIELYTDCKIAINSDTTTVQIQ